MSPSLLEIPCVILSGGRSSRMGEDKSLLPFSTKKSLIQYQYDRLKEHFNNVYISSKTNKFDFLDNNETLILDNAEVFSPIVALKSIFDTLKCDSIFIITVDTPLVKIETIRSLIANSSTYDICIPQTKRTHNLCGIFTSDIMNTINMMLRDDIHKVGYLIKNSNTNVIEYTNDDEFINLNNKEEYNKALQIIS